MSNFETTNLFVNASVSEQLLSLGYTEATNLVSQNFTGTHGYVQALEVDTATGSMGYFTNLNVNAATGGWISMNVAEITYFTGALLGLPNLGVSSTGATGPTGPQGLPGAGPTSLYVYTETGATTPTSFSLDFLAEIRSNELFDLNSQGFQTYFKQPVTVNADPAGDIVFAGISRPEVPWFVGFSFQGDAQYGIVASSGAVNISATGPVSASSIYGLNSDGYNVYWTVGGTTVYSQTMTSIKTMGAVTGALFDGLFATGASDAGQIYTFNNWVAYATGKRGPAYTGPTGPAGGGGGSVDGLYQTEVINSQFIPSMHSNPDLPLVLTPWHLSFLNTNVTTNADFWNSLGIPYTGALYLAAPYTTSQSQTGTLGDPAYLGPIEYPLWNSIRYRQQLNNMIENFTSRVNIEVLPGQEVVYGVGPSPPNTSTWVNNLLTNRMEQIGANDWLALEGTTGVGLSIATLCVIPDTHPITTYNEEVIFTAGEYENWYTPFLGVTGTNILASDNSIYAGTPNASQLWYNLPVPQRVIYPTTLYPTPYNNVSYSQLAAAVLVIKNSNISYATITVGNIITEYNNLYVADPTYYIPMLAREQAAIIANPGFLYLASPTPNNSLAYLIYYGA